MNKTFRQGQILKLIRSKRILTQEDLARELKRYHGIERRKSRCRAISASWAW